MLLQGSLFLDVEKHFLTLYLRKTIHRPSHQLRGREDANTVIKQREMVLPPKPRPPFSGQEETAGVAGNVLFGEEVSTGTCTRRFPK